MKPDHSSISERKPQNILVTGGGGFLGQAIVAGLCARGDRVSSFSRSRYPELDAMGINQITANLADADRVVEACAGMDLVFHIAAHTGVWGPYDDYFRTNVTGTLNIIQACKKNRINRLVYTSSPSVVFDGRDMEGVNETVPYPARYPAHYPRTKALAEQSVIKASSDSLKTIILRPHLIWGPGDNSLVPRILARAKQLARVGNGQNRVDTVYIDNAADAHILAADQLEKNQRLSGRIYFISQDEPILLWDMIDHILKAGGHPPVKRSIPKNIAWLAGAVLELWYYIFRITAEPRMTRFVAHELASAHWFDITAAKNDLGYAPRISTLEGLKRLEEWLKKNDLKGSKQ